jgi:hypothetical protein
MPHRLIALRDRVFLSARDARSAINRHRGRFFLVALVAVVVLAAHFVVPFGQICKTAKDGTQYNCALYDPTLVLLWHISEALNNYAPLLTVAATAAIAWFTFTLWRSTDSLWGAGEHQAKLTREAIGLSQREYVAANRPRLVVRQFYFNDTIGPPKPPHPNFAFIAYTVANTGGSEATIVERREAYHFLPKHTPVPALLPEAYKLTEDLTPIVLASGESHEIRTPVPADHRNRFVLNIDSMAGLNDFYFMGVITYKDPNERLYRMAFCRRYVFETKRFEPVTDPDYEYAD